MEKRILTNLGEETSRLGMGLMRLPEKDGKIDYPAGEAMIGRLMAAGVRYYDTAWFYHDGHSEDFAKKALTSRYPRDSYTIATKLPLGDFETAEEAGQIFEQQRKNLGVETIDFYLLHGIDFSGWEKAVRLGVDKMLDGWKAEGKIRYKGFSFHGDSGELGDILDAMKPDFVQIQLNYYDWMTSDAKIRYDAAHSRGIATVVMGPARGGGLTRYNRQIMKIFEEAGSGHSTASYAMRWAASLPGVDVVLSGMSSLAQAEDNIKTFEGDARLSDADRDVIARALAEFKNLPLIPCTTCRYCKNCPQGIDIARLFNGYNEKVGLGSSWFLDNYQTLIPEEKRGGRCTECGACEAACPQKIGIIEEIKKVMAEI